MLDIYQFANSGRLFDNQYRLIRPLSTDGGTADVWLALDANTVSDPDSIGDLTHLHDDEIEGGLSARLRAFPEREGLCSRAQTPQRQGHPVRIQLPPRRGVL